MNTIRNTSGLTAWLAILLICSNVHSAPNQATSYLMAEPVSLLDFGLYKLEQFLSRAKYLPKGLGRMVTANAWYDWDRDRITLDVQLMTKTGNPTRQQCEDVIHEMLLVGGVEFKTRRRFLNDGVSTFATDFAHSGYTSGTELKDIGKKVDEVLELRVIVSSPNSVSPLRQVECTTKLTDAKIFFSES